MASITASAGRDEFLNLLVTQLKYQDPIDPVKQEDFIQQLSQFSMLEGIEKLNASFESMMKLQQLTQGASLTGRTVEYVDSSGARLNGVVTAASVKDGELMLRIDNKEISIAAVFAVLDPLAH
ncbi:MAG: hypothetical protein KF774_20155 [Planctomyces sp.]|nr:hypothetical protein [Planctomyces sp.]